jgi:hypothetical protein
VDHAVKSLSVCLVVRKNITKSKQEGENV